MHSKAASTAEFLPPITTTFWSKYGCASLKSVATGYYGQHNTLEVEGAELSKVFHYFKEAHPYFDQNVVVIGGKNFSCCDCKTIIHLFDS
jgi:thioredoxin reductase